MDLPTALEHAASTAGLAATSVTELLKNTLPPLQTSAAHSPCPLPTSREWFDFIDTYCTHLEKQAITDIVNAYILRDRGEMEEAERLVVQGTAKLERERVRRALENPDSLDGGGDGGFSERERRRVGRCVGKGCGNVCTHTIGYQGAGEKKGTITRGSILEPERQFFVYHTADQKGFVPTVMDFGGSGMRPLTPVHMRLHRLRREDKEYIAELPEPTRAARWLRMHFTASHGHFVDPKFIFDAYLAAFGHLGDKIYKSDSTTTSDKPAAEQSDDKVNKVDSPITPTDSAIADQGSSPPLLNSDNFIVCILKAIEGAQLRPQDANTLIRGLMVRKRPLTLRSTQIKRNRARLRHYQDYGVIDPPKSLFAQKMMQDPLFVVQMEHGSALRQRYSGPRQPTRDRRSDFNGEGGKDGVAAAMEKLNLEPKNRLSKDNAISTLNPLLLDPQPGNLMYDLAGEYWEDTANPGTSCRRRKTKAAHGGYTDFQDLPPKHDRHDAAFEANYRAQMRMIATEKLPKGVRREVPSTVMKDYETSEGPPA